jgi:hypothetical protein
MKCDVPQRKDDIHTESCTGKRNDPESAVSSTSKANAQEEESRSSSSGRGMYLALRPESSSRKCPSEVKRMLAGLISRWTMPLLRSSSMQTIWREGNGLGEDKYMGVVVHAPIPRHRDRPCPHRISAIATSLLLDFPQPSIPGGRSQIGI